MYVLAFIMHDQEELELYCVTCWYALDFFVGKPKGQLTIHVAVGCHLSVHVLR